MKKENSDKRCECTKRYLDWKNSDASEMIMPEGIEFDPSRPYANFLSGTLPKFLDIDKNADCIGFLDTNPDGYVFLDKRVFNE